MPNHWESSARPLFVKTVFVNGNRHAILFEKDPLLRCGNSSAKKISRPSSSISFSSDFSITSSENSNWDCKISKLKNICPQEPKDLSAELQSCLIKLHLVSNSLTNKSEEEKYFCESGETKQSQNKEEKIYKKRHKFYGNKTWKQKHCDHDFTDNRLIGRKNSRDHSCYTYNSEMNGKKKSYCVVQISSQSPKFILNCGCENDLQGARNNMVISATMHNLIMTPEKIEKPTNQSIDDIFYCEESDSYELYWNNYLTTSYYNSFFERVFRWLDLTNKRKNPKEKIISTEENNSQAKISDKTITFEKTDGSYILVSKHNNKAVTKKKIENNMQTVQCVEDVETEVLGEPNVETVIQSNLQECSSEQSLPLPATKIESNPENNSVKQLNSPDTKPTFKIHDLHLKYPSQENYSSRSENNQRNKLTRNRSIRETKHRSQEIHNAEESNVVVTKINSWNNKNFYKFREQQESRYDGHYEDYTEKFKNQILNEEFTAKSHKSINNPNLTRGGPIFIQNVLSSQRLNKISGLHSEKIVWVAEKHTGRPQLHIFMPSIFVNDGSEDSMSECENVINL